MGTFEQTIENMKQEAAAKGATGLMVIDHSKNQMADQATASGRAARTGSSGRGAIEPTRKLVHPVAKSLHLASC